MNVTPPREPPALFDEDTPTHGVALVQTATADEVRLNTARNAAVQSGLEQLFLAVRGADEMMARDLRLTQQRTTLAAIATALDAVQEEENEHMKRVDFKCVAVPHMESGPGRELAEAWRRKEQEFRRLLLEHSALTAKALQFGPTAKPSPPS